MNNPLTPVKAAILDIKDETHDVRTYTVGADAEKFKDFQPGQFNMVGAPGVGEAPISLSSLVEDGGSFQHTIRSVGSVTQYLEKFFKKGDEIFMRGPYGRPWPIEAARGGDLLLVGGGLGLAPLRPVIQSVIGERSSFGGVTLVYGARDPLNIIYEDEFSKWNESIQILLTVDEVPKGIKWAHATGLVTELLDEARIEPAETTAFICGPEIMMRFVARRLLLEGISPARLYVALERRMKCGIGQCGHCQHGSAFVCKDGPVFLYREISRFPDGLL